MGLPLKLLDVHAVNAGKSFTLDSETVISLADEPHLWFEYTLQPTNWQHYAEWTFLDGCWCKGDWSVHVKAVVMHDKPCTLLSLRHKDDIACRDWDVFYEAKNTFIGQDKYAVEVYPPVSQLRDTTNTYHLLELPYPIGFSYCQ